MDKLPPGQRDPWIFVVGCSMSFLMDPQSLEKELLALGGKVAGWSESETKSRMHSIIANAHSAANGETVQWNGQQRDTRYRLTNEKIIDWLEITSEEEQHLQTIVSGDRKQEIRRRRARERSEIGSENRRRDAPRASSPARSTSRKRATTGSATVPSRSS